MRHYTLPHGGSGLPCFWDKEKARGFRSKSPGRLPTPEGVSHMPKYNRPAVGLWGHSQGQSGLCGHPRRTFSFSRLGLRPGTRSRP